MSFFFRVDEVEVVASEQQSITTQERMTQRIFPPSYVMGRRRDLNVMKMENLNDSSFVPEDDPCSVRFVTEEEEVKLEDVLSMQSNTESVTADGAVDMIDVLIVDDNFFNIDVLEMLIGSNFPHNKMTSCYSGFEALDAIR